MKSIEYLSENVLCPECCGHGSYQNEKGFEELCPICGGDRVMIKLTEYKKVEDIKKIIKEINER